MFCSSDHCTALHGAAAENRPAVCKLLIASKADVDAKDRCAFTFCLYCIMIFNFASNVLF